jgi:hypothetical protein
VAERVIDDKRRDRERRKTIEYTASILIPPKTN